MKKNHYGFTVLEFLIVLSIILILVALVLPALGRSREHTTNEKKVTDLRSVALGIEQYKQICGDYPGTISALQECNDNSNLRDGHSLRDFIPNLDDLGPKFNDGTSGYYYAPLARGISSECSGFHLGVRLSTEVSGTLANGDSNVDSRNQPLCSYSTNGQTFDGTETTRFDIYR